MKGSIPVITNVDAEITLSAEDFRLKMPCQIYSSVHWTQTIEKMISTFEDIKNENLNDTEKIMKHVDKLYIYNSLIGFGGIALFNFFGLLSMFLIFVCQCKCMSCLYHIFWNIEIIFIICTFFISAIIGSLSNVSKDISEILSSQIYSLNQSNANKMDFIFNFSEIGGPVNACIFGEQNLYSLSLD